jgi:hypothetical protein
MQSKHVALFRVWTFLLLSNGGAIGHPVGNAQSISPIVAATPAPTITILTAATGALVRRQGIGNASLDLGRVSYFKGPSIPGQSTRKNPRSFVVSTRFSLRVDCPGSSSSATVNLTMSRIDADPADDITIDGTRLGSASQILLQSMPCGSSSEHRLEVEVPVSTPAGPLGSAVAFVATLNK